MNLLNLPPLSTTRTQDQRELALFRAKFNQLAAKINLSDMVVTESKRLNGHIGPLDKSPCRPIDQPVDIGKPYAVVGRELLT